MFFNELVLVVAALARYIDLGGEGGKGGTGTATGTAATLKTFFIGNGPCGMLPVEKQKEEEGKGDHNNKAAGGGKIFFIPCELIRGNPKLNKQVREEVADFAWVARDEMNEYFEDKDTREYLHRLLQDKSDYYGPGTSQTY